MPNLYPGILPLYRSGQRLACLCAFALFPILIFAQPTISSFTPLAGAVGSTVTINGTYFSATPSANIVRFGTVTANVTSATATALTVTVPVGASYLPLTVTTGGLTAYSNQPFSPTFNDPGQFISSAFSPPTSFPAGSGTGSGPLGIVAMDFDGDGLTDLASANSNDITVSFYLNTSTPGAPSFVQQVTSPLPNSNYYPEALAAGDLDGDGKPDVVMANAGTYDLAVFQNTSTVGHISMTQLPPIAEAGWGSWAAIADLNGDGKPDVAVAEQYSNSFSIFPNTSSIGAISFGAPVPIQIPNMYYPYAVAIADIDGDGKPDLVVTDNSNNTISVFLNKSTAGGTISFAAHLDFPTGNNPDGLAIGDLDGDGKQDIVVANNTDNTLSVFRNTSTAGSVSFTITTQPTGGAPYAVAIADLDGDGHPDVAGASEGANTISVHRNTSSPGAITLATNVDYALPANSSPLDLRLADFDGNGTPDIAEMSDVNSSIAILLNQSPTAPVITSFTPGSGSIGTMVTITGTNFTGATAVSFGGVAATSFSIVNNTTITANVGSTGASGSVEVVTPQGTASRSGFTFNTASAPLTINSFLPTTGTYGTTDTIRGTGLSQTSSVSFGNQPVLNFTILSDSVITAIVGAGASGSLMVTAGTDTVTSPGFIYNQPPSLTVTSFTPSSGPAGTQVTITGGGFLSTPSVWFGGATASNVVVVSDSVLTATVGSGATGNLIVSAFNGSDTASDFTFVVSAPPPNVQLTSFSPASGATGTSITINGQHLSTVNSVRFGGVSASYVQIVSDSEIIAVVGAGASGEVTVANPNSTDSLPNFAYIVDTTTTADSSGSFQLVDFTATLNGNKPFLQWSTVFDAGVSYYSVERGVDGNNFITIATVKSRDAGGLGANYSYTDSLPKPGVNYYRIKAQDTSAGYSYSSILSVQLLSVTMPVYPNPVKYGFFLVDLPSITRSSIFRLTDSWGVVMQVISVPPGVAQERIDIPGLLPGTYRLSWTDGTNIAYQTILVLYK